MKFHSIAAATLAVAAFGATSALAGQERPMFARGHQTLDLAKVSGIPSWTFKWTYKGTAYSASITGNNPKGGAAYTAPVTIFPVSLTCGSTTFSALDKDALSKSGATVVADVVASPMFASGVDFTSGGVDFGSTQYIDAYTRANLYGVGVKKNTKYHLLLGSPTVANLIKITVPSQYCTVTSDFGVTNINADINWFDSNVIQPALKNVQPSTLPIFITTQTYLTSGGCCIGGYHNANSNGQTYAHFTYIQKHGAFSQDVSALSHEIGEWQLDPFVNNTSSPCGGLLENGDPLERNANYGDFAYTLNGFQYDLQDLVTLPYFGAPAKTSVKGEFTFHGEKLLVCQNGQ